MTYTAYWKHKVTDPSVPGDEPQGFFIGKMFAAGAGSRTLDLGCGHGRLYPIIATFTPDVHGLEVSDESIAEAKKYPYTKITKGTAEETDLSSASFDTIIAWGVYDMVEQEQALLEQNRILRDNGLFLVTGKNMDYSPDDQEAIIAEKNAAAKNFPNHFTDVYGLIERIGEFGFAVEEAYGFRRRGDFAKMISFSLDLASPHEPFYEFLLILRKVGQPHWSGEPICFRESVLFRDV